MRSYGRLSSPTCKPGSRVVAHDYDIEGWSPNEVVKLPEIVRTPGGYVHQHTLYLWKIEGNPIRRNYRSVTFQSPAIIKPQPVSPL